LVTRRRIVREIKRAAIIGTASLLTLWIGFHALSAVFPFPTAKLEAWKPGAVVRLNRSPKTWTNAGTDGQVRLHVELSDIAPCIVQATVAAEDRRFRSHPGVDVVAILRASSQNAKAGRVVSGASTISMQVCRMLEERPRTLRSKVIEAFRALQLERIRSKDEILLAYLNNAPYGGNIRGIETAARVYFGKPASDVSIAEAAVLAGLPQSPTRLRPSTRLEPALKRRDYVLDRMLENGAINPSEWSLARNATIHVRSADADATLVHAADMVLRASPEGGVMTLDAEIQSRVWEAVGRHRASLPVGSDVGVVVLDIGTGEVRALVGSADPTDTIDGRNNAALAWRSPGSALKPFVYLAALEESVLTPDSTVWDVPIRRGAWTPHNFDSEFAGEVSAGDALRRSLNVPAILIAEGVGVARCAQLASSAGVRFRIAPDLRSGLAFVTGGAEVRLIDLTNAFATLARAGLKIDWTIVGGGQSVPVQTGVSPQACGVLDDVLSIRRRRAMGLQQVPEEDIAWFMWKTGTSAGRRDAWAVGHNHRFSIGVWVGRFDGRSDPAFVSATAAEPLLASLFQEPMLRASDDPPAPSSLVATRTLVPPPEVSPEVRIVQPSDGAVFMRPLGEAAIKVLATRPGLAWFANGESLGTDPERISLKPGEYEILAVAPDGCSHAIRVSVRSCPDFNNCATD
jgi:penicillin-binding protein 1C